MASSVPTKLCPFCKSVMRADADTCPTCRKSISQEKGKLLSQLGCWLILIGLGVIFGCYFLISLSH